MKRLSEYITESFSRRKYEFKIKVAGDLQEQFEARLKTLLEKYKVDTLKKSGTTPIQSLPLDFPKLKNMQVNMFEVTLDYPATQFELHEYICSNMKVHPDSLVVRAPGEPTEEYQAEHEKREGALLDDPDYKEASNVDVDKYYGTKFNQNLLKELAKESAERAKAQGIKIPSGGEKQEAPVYEGEGKTSPVGSKQNKLPSVKSSKG